MLIQSKEKFFFKSESLLEEFTWLYICESLLYHSDLTSVQGMVQMALEDWYIR